ALGTLRKTVSTSGTVCLRQPSRSRSVGAHVIKTSGRRLLAPSAGVRSLRWAKRIAAPLLLRRQVFLLFTATPCGQEFAHLPEPRLTEWMDISDISATACRQPFLLGGRRDRPSCYSNMSGCVSTSWL